jgi:eukaryotic translation initiation factor 2C
LFGRATKSVSLCPPAFYADLLAYRARYHSKMNWDEGDSSGRSFEQMRQSFVKVKAELSNRLYFV